MVRDTCCFVQKLLALLLLGTPPLLAQAPQAEVLTRIREAIANQATAELSLYESGWPRPIDPAHVQVVSSGRAGSVQFLRARVQSVFHWEPYSVLVSGTDIAIIGGSTYELYVRPAALISQGSTGTTPFSIAESLVLASEVRFGSTHILGSTASDSGSGPAAVTLWRGARPPEWPESGWTRSLDGKTLVRLTALRPRVTAAKFRFTPVVYAFLFDAEGALLAAAVREGKQF